MRHIARHMLSRVLFRGGAAAQLSAKRGFRNPARPRLPIPELKDTCARFLDTVDPLLTAEERARAKEVVSEFQQGPGKDLQKLLVEYERTQHYLPDHRHYRGSYVEAFWDDMVRRGRRGRGALRAGSGGDCARRCCPRAWRSGVSAAGRGAPTPVPRGLAARARRARPQPTTT